MRNLFWKSGNQTRNLVEKPFASEAALEAYVMANQDVLGDIYVFSHQILTGSKKGIPDMIGIDQDGQVCIIELKNVEADESILPQALSYAIWAETNPDSIKAIWLEHEEHPEEIEVIWDNLELRIVLVAPAFKSAVREMRGKIDYPIDLVQIERYAFEGDEFVLVDILEPEPEAKVGVTKVQREWDWDYYREEHGEEATAQFRRTVDALERLAQAQGWDLPYNINKYYTGFKLGNKVVFGVAWGGTYAWKVRCKLAEGEGEAFEGRDWEFQVYDRTFHEATFKPKTKESPDVSELLPMLTKAYHHVSGA
ncbi:MAG: hypothetical protein GX657_10945 [Chloroflexi bacterium]|nr:hypothetical protein [Chloroflexota bacterium]